SAAGSLTNPPSSWPVERSEEEQEAAELHPLVAIVQDQSKPVHERNYLFACHLNRYAKVKKELGDKMQFRNFSYNLIMASANTELARAGQMGILCKNFIPYFISQASLPSAEWLNTVGKIC